MLLGGFAAVDFCGYECFTFLMTNFPAFVSLSLNGSRTFIHTFSVITLIFIMRMNESDCRSTVNTHTHTGSQNNNII